MLTQLSFFALNRRWTEEVRSKDGADFSANVGRDSGNSHVGSHPLPGFGVLEEVLPFPSPCIEEVLSVGDQLVPENSLLSSTFTYIHREKGTQWAEWLGARALGSYGHKFKSLLRHLLSCGLQVSDSAFLSLCELSFHVEMEGNEENTCHRCGVGHGETQPPPSAFGVGPDPPRTEKA